MKNKMDKREEIKIKKAIDQLPALAKLRVFCWCFFNRKKLTRWIFGLDIGKSSYCAFKDANK